MELTDLLAEMLLVNRTGLLCGVMTGVFDDYTWVESVKRGNFRLHPGTVSKGCITIANMSDFAMIHNALMNTSLIQVPCMRSLMARGWVEVVAGGYIKKPCS